jgi:2-polyprenyl-3-methyl-5-hydroxy-6-metoxy-1,4-benzoquinol methylase
MSATDAAWEAWGKADPYFGVLTDARFRRENLDEDARRAFFESGAGHIQIVLSIIQRYVDASYAPKRALDFGCGVGRVLIPLARISEEVVGLDVSPSMIAEAKANCDAAQLSNVQILPSVDSLAGLTGQFDFVHSCLVFQHIPAKRGKQIFVRLMQRLAPGGVAAIQFIYAKEYWPDSFGITPPAAPQTKKRVLGFPIGTKSSAEPASAGGVPIDPSTGEPLMEMNIYSLNQLLFIAHQNGVTRFHTELANHGGELSAFLIMQKGATVPAP